MTLKSFLARRNVKMWVTSGIKTSRPLEDLKNYAVISTSYAMI
jgi:hypothetical protein